MEPRSAADVRSRRRARGFRLAPLLALALAFGCLEREASIVDLNGIDDLRARFNADAGKPRVVLLLSPT